MASSELIPTQTLRGAPPAISRRLPGALAGVALASVLVGLGLAAPPPWRTEAGLVLGGALLGAAAAGGYAWLRLRARALQLRRIGSELEAMLADKWVRELDPADYGAQGGLLAVLNRFVGHVQEREHMVGDLLITNCVLTSEYQSLVRMLDSVNIGLIGLDAHRNVVLANRAAEPYLNDKLDNARGRLAHEAIAIAPVLNMLHRSEAEGSHSSAAIELAPDAERGSGYLSVTRHSVVNEADEVEGQTLVFLDIDRQKQSERMQSEFLDNVAHELRTPMTSILASVEMLTQNQEVAPQLRANFYNIIHEETYRLSNLIDNLLNISMMERGALNLNASPTRMRKFLEDVAEVVRPQCEQNEIQLIVDLPDRLPTLDIDKSLLNVAVMNVVSNAVKYTPAGGKVLIETTSQEDGFRITVQDTGIGIDEQHLKRIFEKFYRIESALSSKVKGSGIGLAFARQIMQLHGGDIKVSSTPGEGSRFTLLLPRALLNTTISE